MHRTGSEGLDAPFHNLGSVVPVIQIHTWRKGVSSFHQVILHFVGKINGILIPDPRNGNHDAAFAIPAGKQRGLLKTINDFCDFAQRQPGAIVSGQKHDVFEIRSDISLSLGSEKDFSTCGLDGSSG